MALKVVVDVKRCLGSGNCLATVPEVFDQEDNGTAIVLNANPPDELRDALEHAVQSCPGLAISLVEDAPTPAAEEV